MSTKRNRKAKLYMSVYVEAVGVVKSKQTELNSTKFAVFYIIEDCFFDLIVL